MIEEVPSREKVKLFLQEIKVKTEIWGIYFRPRRKNTETLLELGITAIQREEFIKDLEIENYYKGPSTDTHDHNKPNYYEFGVEINSKQVYIKLSPGLKNQRVDCMSFHIAERTINYPFLNEDN